LSIDYLFNNLFRKTDLINHALTEQNHQVSTIHGGLDQATRNQIMKMFREGETRVLLTTDLLARGCSVSFFFFFVFFFFFLFFFYFLFYFFFFFCFIFFFFFFFFVIYFNFILFFFFFHAIFFSSLPSYSYITVIIRY
jgi:hypothetical protein